MYLGVTGGRNGLSFERFSALKTEIDYVFDNFPSSVNLVNLDMAPFELLEEIEKELKFICGDDSSYYFFQGHLSARKANLRYKKTIGEAEGAIKLYRKENLTGS